MADGPSQTITIWSRTADWPPGVTRKVHGVIERAEVLCDGGDRDITYTDAELSRRFQLIRNELCAENLNATVVNNGQNEVVFEGVDITDPAVNDRLRTIGGEILGPVSSS